MRVTIGPYVDWFGVYQATKLLQHVGVSEETCDRLAEKAPEKLINFFEWLHSKRKRKIKIKIDDYDVWGLDHTLALIIAPALRILKEKKHGIPADFVDQTSDYTHQCCFDFYSEGDNLAFNSGVERWNATLDKMIWSFEQLDSDWESQYFVNDEYDAVGHKNHGMKIQEGIDLFSKYYFSLWD